MVSFFETSVSGRRRVGARNHSKLSKRLQSGARFQNRSKTLRFARFWRPARRRFQEHEQTAAERCVFLRYAGVRTKTATRSVKMRGRRPNAPQDKAVKNLQFLAVFELVFSTVPQNNLNTMCFEGFMKIVVFAPTCSTTSPSPKCCKNLVFYDAFSWSRQKPHAIQDNIVFIKSSPLSSESFILMFFVLNSRSFFDELDL